VRLIGSFLDAGHVVALGKAGRRLSHVFPMMFDEDLSLAVFKRVSVLSCLVSIRAVDSKSITILWPAAPSGLGSFSFLLGLALLSSGVRIVVS
jgi:hypothetical protein